MGYYKKKVLEFDDVLYKSAYELHQAQRLKEHGINFEYESKKLSYESAVYNSHCRDCGGTSVFSSRIYTPDFYIVDTGIFIETKGKFDGPTRTKMLEVLAHRDEDIRMVFMRDNYLSRKKSMTYSRWCELNNVPYAIGNIPLEWCKQENNNES